MYVPVLLLRSGLRMLQLEYEYEDQSKAMRSSHYVRFSVADKGEGEAAMHRYYLVADNRPLLTLQKWYEDGQDVTGAQF